MTSKYLAARARSQSCVVRALATSACLTIWWTQPCLNSLLLFQFHPAQSGTLPQSGILLAIDLQDDDVEMVHCLCKLAGLGESLSNTRAWAKKPARSLKGDAAYSMSDSQDES